MFNIYNDDEMDRGYEKDHDSREYLLHKATLDDYMEMIGDQIEDPFDSSVGINYLKRIRKLVPDDNKMDTYCVDVIDQITEAYPDMEIDLDNISSHYLDFTMALYKFFVKNIRKLTTVFLKEYIFNTKNRKALVQDYQDAKLGNYPKEQFGNKDNYILITFLKKIVKSFTKSGDLRLEDFIRYVKKSDDCPEYVDVIEEYLNDGTIADYGIYEDLMTYFWESDIRDAMINKLSLKINDAIVQPTLEDMGYKTFPLTLIAQDDDDDLQDNDAEDDPEMADGPDEFPEEYNESEVNS